MQCHVETAESIYQSAIAADKMQLSPMRLMCGGNDQFTPLTRQFRHMGQYEFSITGKLDSVR